MKVCALTKISINPPFTMLNVNICFFFFFCWAWAEPAAQTLTPHEALEYATTLFNSDPSATSTVISILTTLANLPPNQIDPSLAHFPHFYLGSIFHFGGAAEPNISPPTTALHHYKRALEIKPDDSDTLNNLGKLHSDINDVESAVKFYSKALLFDPRHTQARINLGLLEHRRGQFKPAIAQYELALGSSPDSLTLAEIHYNMGVSYQVSERACDSVLAFF